jgi:hypothetical protein
MSAAEIIQELPKLTEAERQRVLDKLRELASSRHAYHEGGSASVDRVEDGRAKYRAVDLRAAGINEIQAADLRARLSTFAEDWNRPEASVYDEDATR